ncbi:HAD-IA family hydrolase [Catellatospora sp. KI3]|uniref:HAD family hydrolase n=1 Tax=Catellatospora sp. KI3 TaxID=3041620 RepID=UPI00248242A0|nr:HAD-IA family hydrolase [Catellatospora sp. KI3]MDI1464518.1 HAD-IA family hydrolase [Catellatospora sp. KI3]
MSDTAPTPAAREDRIDGQRRLDAVLFDFHGTLAMTVDPVAWVTAAAAACGTDLDRGRATVLADRIATAGGLPGVAKPVRVPPQLAEAWADRDLYEHAHRQAYLGLAATVATDIPGLAEAVYERILVAEGWQPYPDARPTMAALRAAGVKVAVVSNIGFDIRPLLDAWGLTELCDAVVLSYEVGCIKPDQKIFLRACGMLAVDPERTLMVGDTPADAGAVSIGCSALIVPAASAGRPNGLHRALSLAVSPLPT